MPKRPLLLQVGQNIRARRKELGISQEQLALQTGLDRTYIGGVERGERNLGVINLARIAGALGVSPARLLQDVRYDQSGEDQSA